MKTQSLNTPFTWLASALAALAIFASCTNGPTEAEAAQDVAADAAQVQTAMAARPDLLEALEATKPGTEPHRAAVADLCHHTRGHDAELLTLPDGGLVCRRSKVQVAAKGDAL